MRRRLLALLVGALAVLASAEEPGLIPMPRSVQQADGFFDTNTKGACSIYFSPKVSPFNKSVADSLLRGSLVPKLVSTSNSKNAKIILTIDPSLPSEGYNLDISVDRIKLSGADNAGVYYGLMTLRQLINSEKLSCVSINDSPRYGFRGLMIDPARHFLPADDVKRFIDIMSKFKFNALQIHLTDDQGWRMEVASHPELTEGQQHYTQQELRDIVSYARERNVDIIPEIDVPGHTAAFLHAHPELKCTPHDTLNIELGKTVNLMLCAAKDSVYAIYDDIIGEMAAIFPSERIHLGGDESAISSNWELCDADRALADSLGLKNSSEIMAYFFNRIFASVRECGKKPVMWCELDNIRMPAREYFFDYPSDVTLVTWRNGLTPKCIELAEKSGHPLVMAPGEFAYLDYPQYVNDFPEFNNWGMPTTTLEKVYAFDPAYGGEHPMIEGVMGTLWGEAMPDINRVTYMAFPRALALAEAGWSPMEVRDWDSFRSRLVPVLMTLMKDGVSFRVPFEIY